MTRVLQELLGNDHPLFVSNLHEFEKASGGAGIDTRLIADITEKAHAIMRSLGLDPADTRAIELYRTLIAAVGSGKANDLLRGADYVLLAFDEGLVSFNLQDVVENSHHELAFAERTYGHAQRHLRMEIVRRYAEHERTDASVVHESSKRVGLVHELDHQYPVIDDKETLKPKKSGPYILAIGDIFTDAFILLTDEAARIDTDPDGSKRLSLPFGAKPPYDHVDIVKSVGPSPNSAVSCARLGLDVGLMAWLGDDTAGQESLEHLHSEHVDTTHMITEPGKKSSYWYVLRYGADRTMLVKSESYDYRWHAPARVPDWIYLSYIGADSWDLHEQLVTYLEEHPKTRLAFQPGTFHFHWGTEKLAQIYAHSYIVMMNREEAVEVTGRSYDSLKGLAAGLHALGPEVVVITDGPNGSYASYGDVLYTIPNYPDPAPPLDRTGAGDAFSSTVVAALALGESIATALTWAPINSMNVVQKIGAQAGLLDLKQIKRYLKEAPENYTVTEFEG